MSMRSFQPLIVAAGAAALLGMAAAAPAQAGVSANGTPVKVAATLDCPAIEGRLTRVAVASDGQSCDYEGRDGDTVRLRLMPLNGRAPNEALALMRTDLHALVPVYREATPVSYSEAGGDEARIDLPFLHVHAVGDSADVRLFGIHIHDHEHGANTDVTVEHGRKRSVVHAGMRGVEVIADDVGRSNASLVYVLAANHRTPSGLRAAGYVARGPVTGPLVVAEFHSTRDHHGRYDHGGSDVDRLIDHNLDD
jgi:hypothetical protein